MNPAKEHLDKHIARLDKRSQDAEDRRRRKQDVFFRRIELGIMAYAAVVSTIALIVSTIALMK